MGIELKMYDYYPPPFEKSTTGEKVELNQDKIRNTPLPGTSESLEIGETMNFGKLGDAPCVVDMLCYPCGNHRKRYG